MCRARESGRGRRALWGDSEQGFRRCHVRLQLAGEEHAPRDLVRNARRAEEAGFDFVSISDHYHPWVSAQGHSPFVWSVLGAIAASTELVRVGVGVTCPTMRIHPAILAQASATTSLLLDGRFFFGVGTREALNEHIIRSLWTGETLDHRGEFYEVENAKLFDSPAVAPPIIVSGFGPKAVELAARIGDGYWGHSPEREMLDQYRDNGGTGPRYSQLNICWAEDAAVARKMVHEIWPNAGITGQLPHDLPTWTRIEQAAAMVREADATESVPCGPDVEPIVESVQAFLGAGYDHVYFHQIGPDQDGFFRFWSDSLQPALADMSND